MSNSGANNAEQSPPSIRKIAFASLIGTSIEWYDFFIYATASALVLNQVFFPTFSPVAGTLAAFSTFAVAFFARPLGGVIFGHFGDRVGRKSMLVITLLLMGLSTVGVGLLPTFNTVGVLAPILLVALRFLQGISVGGEWGGAILMATEHAPERQRNFYGSFPQLGSPVGSISSSAVFALVSFLPDEQFFTWGWRVPFLLSAILIVVGLYVRLRITESPAFAQVKENRTEARVPIVDLLRSYPIVALLGVGAVFYGVGGYYMTNTYALSFATSQLDVVRNVMLIGITIGGITQIIGTLSGSSLADRIGRRKVILVSGVAIPLYAFPFFWLITTEVTPLIILSYAIYGFIGGILYGLLGLFLSGLFGTRVRYSGISFSYQVGGMIAGGLAPIIATTLVAWAGGSYWPAAALLSAYGLISLICIYIASKRKYQQDIHEKRTLTSNVGDLETETR